MDQRSLRAGHFAWALTLRLALLSHLAWLSIMIMAVAQAEVITSITPTTGTGDLGTIVTQTGHLYDITGGSRPGNGTNLFHSFGTFSVGAGDIGNFVNDTGFPTSNILGRVTGGDISNIFGTIQTTGFGHANLFLMNPHGFLFGPTATINVGGMVAFTSADYLRLVDGAIFNAIPNLSADTLLSAAPVAAFGFLGSNPGAITVQGSQFTVTEGTGMSLVGGNITIQSGTLDGGVVQRARLEAPNGTIQLASAASPGEFNAATLQPLPNITQMSFSSSGSAVLVPGSHINVTGEQTVSIRGGQFVLSVHDTVLSTAESAGAPATISLSSGSAMISSNAGAQAGADVQLHASKVQLDGTYIQSVTTGTGAGGNISITAALDGEPNSNTTGSVQMTGGQIQTASLGPAKVGDIQIHSGSLSMTDGALIDSLLFPNRLIPGQPAGGTVAITTTDSIFVTGQHPGTTTFLPSVPGLPTFMNMPSGIYSENFSANPGSDVVVHTPSLTLQPGHIGSDAFGAGAAGNLSLLLGQLMIKEGGLIVSYAFGAGATGNIQLRASDSIDISGFLPGIVHLGPFVLRDVDSSIATGTLGLGEAGTVSIFTRTFNMGGSSIASFTLGPGGAGEVNIQARTINMTGGASIGGTSFGSGPGGIVSVTASEELSISGHRQQSLSFGSNVSTKNPSDIDAVALGTGSAGAITVNTPRLTMFDGGHITSATAGDGSAGAVTVNAGSITISSGASITSSSGVDVGLATGFQFGNGAGGTVTVNATGPVTIADQGSGLFTTTVDSGVGGNINLRGSSIQLNNGASISATSSGSGHAGEITVNAGNQFEMVNSSVTTEAHQSSGGAIKITTHPGGTVQLTDSTISASVLDGMGGGGSVNIDPQSVILLNSQILAQAVQGPGGNISITTKLLLPDAASVISASSQFGQNGNITVQSPNAPISGQIQPLGHTPLLETSLLNQHCAAMADGQFSSFTVAGRDRLPTEPGGWLPSPLAFAADDLAGIMASQPKRQSSISQPAEEPLVLSLRRIAPSGFLTQTFAVDRSGCTS